MSSVLIIEDEMPRLRLLALAISERGHDVSGARSVTEALPMLLARPIDAVIINTDTSEDEKRRAINALRLVTRVPIIDLTGTVSENTGADAHIHPPHRVDDILASLNSLCP